MRIVAISDILSVSKFPAEPFKTVGTLAMCTAMAVAAGCSHLTPKTPSTPDAEPSASLGGCDGNSWRETKLFLGMGGFADTPLVTDFELMDFVDEVVTPRFYSGYTLIRGTGAWMDEDQSSTTTEPSAILLILHPDDPTIPGNIKEIGEAYLKRFDQPATLMSWTHHCTEFIQPPSTAGSED